MKLTTLTVDTHEQRIWTAQNLQEKGYTENYAATTRICTVMARGQETVRIVVRGQ